VATKTPKPTAEPATEAPATEAPATEAPATDVPPTDAPPSEEPATDAPPTDQPASQAPESVAPPTSGPTGSQIPGTEDQDVILGDPVVIPDEFLPEVALLTQNIGDVVKDYSIKATFKDGDTITATADGYISNHAPGTIRVAYLFLTGDFNPTDTVTVALDSLYDGDPSTPETEAAAQVTFGPPAISTGDFPSIDVEVTNGSDQTLDSVSVVAAIVRDGVIVGTASGSVSDMAPGQVKTASLYVTGELADTDQLLLTVDSVYIATE
jgi:hypothetical protein